MGKCLLNIKQILSYFLCLLVLGSCQYTKNSGPKPEIDMSPQVLTMIEFERDFNNKRELRLSEIADDIEYIKLEATPRSYIGERTNIWHIDQNYIFVVSNDRLLQFNRKGKFIREIGKYGKGPGEHLGIRGFDLDAKKETLYVVSNFTATVLQYDLQTGKFLGDFAIDRRFGDSMIRRSFQNIGRDSFAVLSEIGCQFQPDYNILEIIDQNGIVLSEISTSLYSTLSNKSVRRIACTFNQLWSFSWQVRLFEGHNDTIYNLNGSQLSPAFILKLGHFKGSLEYMTSQYILNIEKYVQVFNFFETFNYLFFCYIQDGVFSNLMLFDKMTGTTFRLTSPEGDTPSIVNDLDGGLSFYPGFSFHNVFQEWVTIYSPSDLKERLTSKHFKKYASVDPVKEAQLQKFVTDLSIEDNPVVVIVRLKSK